VVIGGAAHGFPELADPGPARGDPGAEGAGLLQFAEEGGAATEPVELFWRLAGVLGHGGTILVGSGEAPLGRGPTGLNRLLSHPKRAATSGWRIADGSVRRMQILVVDHPLVAHKLTTLRDERTDSPTFRRLTEELVTLLAYEATRDVRTGPITVQTPVAEASGIKLTAPKPLVVPILRAGLGMLEGMSRLLPTAEVGFLGMIRNEETLNASTYAERLPEDLSGRQCYVLDPMLATGGTLAAAIRFLVDRGADHITAICLLAAPEGVERIEGELADLDVPVNLVIAGMDSHLNEKGYIVPGLGDAGDRLYGVAQ
jgi:uracil phosphoribosyltransferase